MSHLEVALGRHPAGMDHTFRRLLAVELAQLVHQVHVVQQHRTYSSSTTWLLTENTLALSTGFANRQNMKVRRSDKELRTRLAVAEQYASQKRQCGPQRRPCLQRNLWHA